MCMCSPEVCPQSSCTSKCCNLYLMASVLAVYTVQYMHYYYYMLNVYQSIYIVVRYVCSEVCTYVRVVCVLYVHNSVA